MHKWSHKSISLKKPYLRYCWETYQNRISCHRNDFLVREWFCDFGKPIFTDWAVTIETGNNVSRRLFKAVFSRVDWSLFLSMQFIETYSRKFSRDLHCSIRTVMCYENDFTWFFCLKRDGFETFADMSFFIMCDDENRYFLVCVFFWGVVQKREHRVIHDDIHSLSQSHVLGISVRGVWEEQGNVAQQSPIFWVFCVGWMKKFRDRLSSFLL